MTTTKNLIDIKKQKTQDNFIESNSIFFFYKINNPYEIQQQLPDNLDLIPITIFGENQTYYLIFRIYKNCNKTLSIGNLQISVIVKKLDNSSSNSSRNSLNEIDSEFYERNNDLFFFYNIAEYSNIEDTTQIIVKKSIDNSISYIYNHENQIFCSAVDINHNKLKKTNLSSNDNNKIVYLSNNLNNDNIYGYITKDFIINNNLFTDIRNNKPEFCLLVPYCISLYSLV